MRIKKIQRASINLPEDFLPIWEQFKIKISQDPKIQHYINTHPNKVMNPTRLISYGIRSLIVSYMQKANAPNNQPQEENKE